MTIEIGKVSTKLHADLRLEVSIPINKKDLKFEIISDHCKEILPVRSEFAIAAAFDKAFMGKEDITCEDPIDPVFLSNIGFFQDRLIAPTEGTSIVWKKQNAEWKNKFKKFNVRASHDKILGSTPKTRVGLFFSGGIDSVYSLMSMGDITDAIHVHNTYINKPNSEAAITMLRHLRPEIRLHRVITPLEEKDPERWAILTHGTYVYAVGLMFSNYLTSIVFSGTDRIDGAECGTGHDIDYLMSSSRMRFVSCGHVFKYKKYEFLSKLPQAEYIFNHTQTCPTAFRDKTGFGKMNCSRCLKCLIDMSYADAFGLRKYGEMMFKYNDFVGDLKNIKPGQEPFVYGMFYPLIEQYKKTGRQDMASIFEKIYNDHIKTIK